jgi:hypothetical protein
MAERSGICGRVVDVWCSHFLSCTFRLQIAVAAEIDFTKAAKVDAVLSAYAMPVKDCEGMSTNPSNVRRARGCVTVSGKEKRRDYVMRSLHGGLDSVFQVTSVVILGVTK